MKTNEIRLVAIDIDGTLLDSREILHPETVNAVRNVQRQGIHVTLATGRTFVSAVPFAKQLGLELPIVTHNGAYVAAVGAMEPLSRTPMEMAVLKDLLGELEASDLYVKMYVDDHLFVQIATEETVSFSKKHGVPYTEVGPRNLSLLAHDPLRIVIIDTPERIERANQIIKPWKRQFNFYRESNTGLEIVNRRVDKSLGLDQICQALRIHKNQVMAIGNEENDRKMIREAGIGVAMGNSLPHLKKEANIITKSNDDLGVAHILNTFFLE